MVKKKFERKSEGIYTELHPYALLIGSNVLDECQIGVLQQVAHEMLQRVTPPTQYIEQGLD